MSRLRSSPVLFHVFLQNSYNAGDPCVKKRRSLPCSRFSSYLLSRTLHYSTLSYCLPEGSSKRWKPKNPPPPLFVFLVSNFSHKSNPSPSGISQCSIRRSPQWRRWGALFSLLERMHIRISYGIQMTLLDPAAPYFNKSDCFLMVDALLWSSFLSWKTITKPIRQERSHAHYRTYCYTWNPHS